MPVHILGMAEVVLSKASTAPPSSSRHCVCVCVCVPVCVSGKNNFHLRDYKLYIKREYTCLSSIFSHGTNVCTTYTINDN